MTQIRVKLEVLTTDLVAREDPSCRLTVVNEDTRILEVPNLDMNPEWWSRFVVEDLGTGAAQSFDPKTIWAERRVKPMHVWECGLLGIAAHMDPDDNIRGVLVGQSSSSDSTAPATIFRWSVEVGGRSVADPPSVWAGLDQHLLEHFQLAIDVHGIPHALVRWSEDQWWCLTPETRHAVSPPMEHPSSDCPFRVS